jgi:hypothetical protein
MINFFVWQWWPTQLVAPAPSFHAVYFALLDAIIDQCYLSYLPIGPNENTDLSTTASVGKSVLSVIFCVMQSLENESQRSCNSVSLTGITEWKDLVPGTVLGVLYLSWYLGSSKAISDFFT